MLRSAIDCVQLDGVSYVAQIEVQIRWRTGVITRLLVDRYRRGTDALKTPADAVHRIHELATTCTYAEIAAQLNADGWRTAHGRSFTSQHVGYICRRDGLTRDMGCRRLTPKEDAEKIH